MITFDLIAKIAISIEGLILFKYLSTLFYPKYSNKITAICLILGFAIHSITYSSDTVILNSTINIILVFLICKLLFKTNIKDSIIHTTIVTLVLAASEIILIMCFNLMYNDMSVYISNPAVGTCLIIISKFLYFITMLSILNFYPAKESDEFTISTQWSIWLTPLATFIMYMIFMNVLFCEELNHFLEISITIICIIFLIANILIFIADTRFKKLNHQYLETQKTLQREIIDKQFYSLLDEQNENQRILIHDIRKHLRIIDDLVNEKSFDDIKNYIKELEKNPVLQTNIKFSENHILSLVLSRYHQMFLNNKINANFMVMPHSIDFIEDNDLTSLFGNLLDNSYEAALNCEGSFVDLSIRYDDLQKVTTINIVNTYKTAPVQINDEFQTIKKDKTAHGYGIKSIINVVEKYNGFYKFYSDDKNKTFHCVIIMPFM
ncbi:MAG: GHKL domain-containing protein [Clostridia bacterium]